MPIVILTFVRHGESVNNTKHLMSGWMDTPLSNHGINQAKAAGESFSTTPFSYIITSPLVRAYDTAQAVRSAQPESTRPELVSSPLLRAQHFGIAEGSECTKQRQPGLSDEEHWAKGIFPVLDGRKAKYPEGESLDDLRARARQAVKELAVPIIRDAVKEKKENVHAALVSHGLSIGELVAAVVAFDYERKSKDLEVPDRQYTGLLNTAWTRVTIDLADVVETVVDENGLPALSIEVTDVNRHQHLDSIQRQRGFDSQACDPAQCDTPKSFGGDIIDAKKAAPRRGGHRVM